MDLYSATVHTEDEVVDGADLRVRVGQVAAGLRSLGGGPGDCVCLLLRNDISFLEVTLAAQQLGAYAVPLNWHFKRDELLYVIRDAAPKVLIAHEDLLEELARALPAGLTTIAVPTPPALKKAFRVGSGQMTLCGNSGWADWVAKQVPTFETATMLPDSVIYTSATTGDPKGVRRRPATPEQAQKAERMRSVVYDIGAGDRVQVAAPLYHAAPNYFALRAARLSERLVLQPRFDAEAFLAAIERHAITHVYAVPTMFVRLLELPPEVRQSYDLSSLRFVLHAGGPCAPAVKQAMIDWLGPVVNEYYGTTEHGPLTFCTSQEWLSHPGTVGRPAPYVTLSIQDEEGRPLPEGIAGEILGRNFAHPDFTYHKREAERRELQRGELIMTGDIGYLDADGFLYLCDRKRDVVISGGVNIYPAEIEGVLTGFPDVADCAVFGIPDPLFGEALIAIVQPRAGGTIDAARLRDFLSTRLASYKVPGRIEIHQDLPREESGKIRKRLLRDQLLGREAIGSGGGR